MPHLEFVIEKAAADFAQSIIAAVKAASLQELLALSGETPKRRGRPPKAKPQKLPKENKRTKARKKIEWPKCKHKGCTKNAWAQGKGYCGEHAKKKAKR